MGQPIIQFEHISKAFAGQLVLRDLSLSIESGEFVTVIGRSGCGKTTLLRLINRLITPDQGCVMVQGQDVAQTDPIALRRRIGYAIQSVGLFPHMTVEKNIAYVPSISGMDRMEGEELSEAGGRTAGAGGTGSNTCRSLSKNVVRWTASACRNCQSTGSETGDPSDG